ncbi:MAG: lipase secretion chaperone [Pseudomonadota bacterium]|nr:lipase secretion chaperone [Pseudomonadota bacterium]
MHRARPLARVGTSASARAWRRAGLWAAALGLGAGVLWWWLAPAPAAPGVVAAPRVEGAPPTAWFAPHVGTPTPLTPTEAARMALLQTPRLALRLEDVIGDELGTGSFRDDPEGFKQRLAARLRSAFPAEQAEAAIALMHRYVDYRMALDALHLSSAQDPASLRQAHEARRKVREAFFDDAEYNALFAAQDRLDDYTLARLDIEADTQLNAKEREQAVEQAAAAMLTPEERAQRDGWQQHLALQQQTAQLDAKGASDAERYTAREARFGAPAAQRLAELDQTERQWDARLGQYVQAQAELQASTLPPAQQQAQLRALRQQLFNAQEQLRLDGALALRQAQGTPR